MLVILGDEYHDAVHLPQADRLQARERPWDLPQTESK